MASTTTVKDTSCEHAPVKGQPLHFRAKCPECVEKAYKQGMDLIPCLSTQTIHQHLIDVRGWDTESPIERPLYLESNRREVQGSC